ncbi:MAG: hypothetical protein B0D92_00975 [Spirochaeta sp. LUC14_002_19_P3]|nr:MAG: hypothetical protein B0D92_00975 [Spirochaeta sp. LUC14_002_19_P3]
MTKKFFVGQQKRSVAGLREHFDNLRAAEKFESRTKWGFLEVPINFTRCALGIGGARKRPAAGRLKPRIARPRAGRKGCAGNAQINTGHNERGMV